LFLSECERCDAHRRTSRQTVVNQNHRLPTHIYRRTPLSVLPLSTFQFTVLFLRYLIDDLFGYAKRAG
jgi:hypothetical protein